MEQAEKFELYYKPLITGTSVPSFLAIIHNQLWMKRKDYRSSKSH
jgi:hypothetical protein